MFASMKTDSIKFMSGKDETFESFNKKNPVFSFYFESSYFHFFPCFNWKNLF